MASTPRPKFSKWRDRDADIKHVPLPRSLADNGPSPATALEIKEQKAPLDGDTKGLLILQLTDIQRAAVMYILDEFGHGSTKPIAVKERAAAMAVEIGYFEEQSMRDIARRLSLPQASLWRRCKCRPWEKIRAGWLGPNPKK